MSEIRICKYCGMELLEDVPHGLRNCHLHAVARIAELEAENDRLQGAWFKDETICPDGSLKPKVSTLLSRIAELEMDNAEFRQLIRDWSIVLDQNNGFQLWQVESVRQAMLEINKESEE